MRRLFSLLSNLYAINISFRIITEKTGVLANGVSDIYEQGYSLKVNGGCVFVIIRPVSTGWIWKALMSIYDSNEALLSKFPPIIRGPTIIRYFVNSVSSYLKEFKSLDPVAIVCRFAFSVSITRLSNGNIAFKSWYYETYITSWRTSFRRCKIYRHKFTVMLVSPIWIISLKNYVSILPDLNTVRGMPRYSPYKIEIHWEGATQISQDSYH